MYKALHRYSLQPQASAIRQKELLTIFEINKGCQSFTFFCLSQSQEVLRQGAWRALRRPRTVPVARAAGSHLCVQDRDWEGGRGPVGRARRRRMCGQLAARGSGPRCPGWMTAPVTAGLWPSRIVTRITRIDAVERGRGVGQGCPLPRRRHGGGGGGGGGGHGEAVGEGLELLVPAPLPEPALRLTVLLPPALLALLLAHVGGVRRWHLPTRSFCRGL